MSDKTNSSNERQLAIRVVLLPRDANKHGTIFGGIILSYIDLAGSVEVTRHTLQKYVTAGIKEVDFKAPVMVGEVISFYTKLIRIGRTSITVNIDVEVDRENKVIPVTHAELTFVCIDENCRPTPVVPIKT